MLDLSFQYDKAEKSGHTSRSQTFQMSALQSAFLKPTGRFLLQTEQPLLRQMCQYFYDTKQGDRQEVGGVEDPLSRLVMDMTAARFMR